MLDTVPDLQQSGQVAHDWTKDDARFWANVDRGDGCWLWRGSKNGGYASFWVFGRRVWAHRYAYAREVGPIQKNLVIDHLCRMPSCVRPSHLEAVTNRENIMRGLVGARMTKRKLWCKNGHPLFGENVKPTTQGYRRCRICANAFHRTWRREKVVQARAKKLADGLYVKPVDKNVPYNCKNGHWVDKENVLYAERGKRRCKKCDIEQKLARYAQEKKQAAALGIGIVAYRKAKRNASAAPSPTKSFRHT